MTVLIANLSLTISFKTLWQRSHFAQFEEKMAILPVNGTCYLVINFLKDANNVLFYYSLMFVLMQQTCESVLCDEKTNKIEIT